MNLQVGDIRYHSQKMNGYFVSRLYVVKKIKDRYTIVDSIFEFKTIKLTMNQEEFTSAIDNTPILLHKNYRDALRLLFKVSIIEDEKN